MKLHLALAGLALISPFATAAQPIVATAGIDKTDKKLDNEQASNNVKGDAGDIVARAIDASANAEKNGQRSLEAQDGTVDFEQPPTPDQTVVDSTSPGFEKYPPEFDICFQTFKRRENPCGAKETGADIVSDLIEFQLSDTTIYTFSVSRISCMFDPASVLLFKGVDGELEDGLFQAKSDDVKLSPAFCTDLPAGTKQAPEIMFDVQKSGTFQLATGPFGGSFPTCPAETGYDYEIVVTCEFKPGTTQSHGDPHFKTWRGQHFDYHGECDLVLLHDPDFGSGFGLDVHIRTEIRREFSFISLAALRIGEDVLEVASQGVYWLNGVQNADLPKEFSGFEFSHTQPTDKQHKFEVHLGGRERIKLNTYKDFVSVLIEQGTSKNFLNTVGLMGNFRSGHMLARDGKTVMENWNAYGQEWQVLETEPSLFQTLRLPQHPMQCTLPTPKQTSQLRRRLSATSSADELAAEKACEHWGEGKDDCVFDVLATGDLAMASAGTY